MVKHPLPLFSRAKHRWVTGQWHFRGLANFKLVPMPHVAPPLELGFGTGPRLARFYTDSRDFQKPPLWDLYSKSCGVRKKWLLFSCTQTAETQQKCPGFTQKQQQTGLLSCFFFFSLFFLLTEFYNMKHPIKSEISDIKGHELFINFFTLDFLPFCSFLKSFCVCVWEEYLGPGVKSGR